jgi:hypothetical protein
MKRINIYLILGFVIVLLFAVIIIFPKLFTEKSPYEVAGVESYKTKDGNYSILKLFQILKSKHLLYF